MIFSLNLEICLKSSQFSGLRPKNSQFSSQDPPPEQPTNLQPCQAVYRTASSGNSRSQSEPVVPTVNTERSVPMSDNVKPTKTVNQESVDVLKGKLVSAISLYSDGAEKAS